MISATLIKYGLIAIAVISLFTGVYAMGYSHGSSTGYTSGWNAQQATIDKMVSNANAQRTAQNNQITSLEQQAAKDASDLFAAKAKAALTSQTIVTQYKTKYVTVAQSCGWSAPTVDTINSLLNVGQAPTTATATANTGVAQ
jgi:hypothetical protein